MEEEIICILTKNHRLYTYQVKDGKKIRVSNEYAQTARPGCKNVKSCPSRRVLCKGGKISSKLPCKKKRHIFNSKEDVEEYCLLLEARPKGDYERRDRKAIVERVNEEDKQSALPKKKSSKKVKFASTRTLFV